ncbi:MAG: hydrogenase expression/formation protein [Gammaproteobacteria bacterium]|nr:hydrogenase expression/formation protein [Gammaproteobacteria bacterium]
MKPFPLSVETENTPVDLSTGNVRPILNEIFHALERLQAEGESQTIDLKAMPMAPGDLTRIERFLGEGELAASLNALGRSEIRESRYPGVWLTTHYGENDDVIGRFVEVTVCPEILKTQREELDGSLAAFGEHLAEEQFHF